MQGNGRWLLTLHEKTAQSLEMGPSDCPGTLVISYQTMVCNNPRRAKIPTITWLMPDILQLDSFISLPHISTKLGHHQGVYIFLKEN
jgi:hypothetical protein